MELLRPLLAIGVVFGLLAGALWLLRWRGALRWSRPAGLKRSPPRLETIDRLALSPQHALHLVRASEQVLLIATHTAGCTMLAQLPAERGDRSPRPETQCPAPGRLLQ